MAKVNLVHTVGRTRVLTLVASDLGSNEAPTVLARFEDPLPEFDLPSEDDVHVTVERHRDGASYAIQFSTATAKPPVETPAPLLVEETPAKKRGRPRKEPVAEATPVAEEPAKEKKVRAPRQKKADAEPKVASYSEAQAAPDSSSKSKLEGLAKTVEAAKAASPSLEVRETFVDEDGQTIDAATGEVIQSSGALNDLLDVLSPGDSAHPF